MNEVHNWKVGLMLNYRVILSQKPAAKKLAVPAKNGTVGYPVKKGKEPSRSYSDSEDDKVPKTKVTALSKKMPATAAKNGALSHPKKENDSSDSSDSDAESDEEDVSIGYKLSGFLFSCSRT
ncbi:hypothetical protein CJ030_MR4G016052 [Morella rubra]|uniref:Uncharacterized protein n=1 Tax=Morella rubra TaxID=262757 RepID=A0A6A1VW13_9ROSI|nr:hypothetical protein CJ030_MR4G016052 [Morella rubra]